MVCSYRQYSLTTATHFLYYKNIKLQLDSSGYLFKSLHHYFVDRKVFFRLTNHRQHSIESTSNIRLEWENANCSRKECNTISYCVKNAIIFTQIEYQLPLHIRFWRKLMMGYMIPLKEKKLLFRILYIRKSNGNWKDKTMNPPSV